MASRGRGGRFLGSCGCFLCPLVGMQALCCPRRRAELRRGCPRSWATAARCPAIARCRIWPQRRWRFEFRNRASVCRYARSPWFKRFACAQARQALRLGRRATWETQRLHCWRDPHNYSAYQAVQGTIHAVQHCSLTPSTRRSVKDGPAAGQTSGSQHILIRIQRVGPVRPPASLSTSRLHTPSRRRRA